MANRIHQNAIRLDLYICNIFLLFGSRQNSKYVRYSTISVIGFYYSTNVKQVFSDLHNSFTSTSTFACSYSAVVGVAIRVPVTVSESSDGCELIAEASLAY
ncbi:hypothetical protein T12_11699 [Trichinella patagoniensis]|uniref:Uncharacterized protein n=1 Tax=Trichinella patagoniensis TaxID=990121 RepID=A0A0V0ZSZ8_9BILA|nr:hypothetical protein T12_11699 [Trichinella patagoniensis]